MSPLWRDAARHWLQVLALCSVVAVFTTLMWPNRSYGSQLVYSVCIGSLCWATMEFGRYLVPAKHCHADAEGGRGWPQGWRGLVLTAVGIAVGFYVGDWLAFQLIGPASPGRTASSRDNAASLYITIAAGAIGAYRGTRDAPVGRVQPGTGTLAEQLHIVGDAAEFKWLLLTFVLQALATTPQKIDAVWTTGSESRVVAEAFAEANRPQPLITLRPRDGVPMVVARRVI